VIDSGGGSGCGVIDSGGGDGVSDSGGDSRVSSSGGGVGVEHGYLMIIMEK
jgi:hypothetical protein